MALKSDCDDAQFKLWELPEVLLYHIVGFTVPPTHRARILCHKIAPLCRGSYRCILQDEERSAALWDAVLIGDYGVDKSKESSKGKRSCKRLRRSPCHQVRDAHNLLKDNTEIAFLYMSEMANTSSAKEGLTAAKLRGVLREYGNPQLRVNNRVKTGGTFLVEICRARHVKESTILQCVEELVERQGAQLDLSTFESQNSSLTALCVAAARGMPSVVKYLIGKGADHTVMCSGRFRLYACSRKSIKCTDSTPLQFSQTMLEAEIAAGASSRDLKNIRKCVTLLEGAVK